MKYGVSMTTLPARSTFTRLDAVISSNRKPYGLIRKWCCGPGTRKEICVKTRSSHPYRAVNRYIAARSTRACHSAGDMRSFTLACFMAVSFKNVVWQVDDGCQFC